jgi:hypothetical protein
MAAPALSSAAESTNPATATAAMPSSGGKYCLVVVERIAPDNPETRVVSESCSSEAKPGTVLPKQAAASVASTDLLVTFFENQAYGGLFVTMAGSDGTCDSQGYSFSDLNYTNYFQVYGISSYKLNGNCNRAEYWNAVNYGGYKSTKNTQHVSYVGTTWNDKLLSMKIRS